MTNDRSHAADCAVTVMHTIFRDVEQMATVMAMSALQLADLPALLPRNPPFKTP